MSIIKIPSNTEVRTLYLPSGSTTLAFEGSGKIVYKVDGVLTGIDDETGTTLNSGNTSDVVSVTSYITYISDESNILKITIAEGTGVDPTTNATNITSNTALIEAVKTGLGALEASTAADVTGAVADLNTLIAALVALDV